MSFLEGVKRFLTGRNTDAYLQAKTRAWQDIRSSASEAASATRDYFRADGEYNKLWLDADQKHARLYTDLQKYEKMQRKVDRLNRKLAKASERLRAQEKSVIRDMLTVQDAEDTKDAAERKDSEAGRKAKTAIGGMFHTIAADIGKVWKSGQA